MQHPIILSWGHKEWYNNAPSAQTIDDWSVLLSIADNLHGDMIGLGNKRRNNDRLICGSEVNK